MKPRHVAALALFGISHYGASVFCAISASAQLLRPDSRLWYFAVVILAPPSEVQRSLHVSWLGCFGTGLIRR